jgi:DNA replication and repair protein RecF
MWLRSLDIHNFRNIQQAHIEFVDGLNFLIGDNGSGKTSILEAAQCLSTGRSFRTSKKLPIITFNQASFVIYGELFNEKTLTRIGLKKNRTESTVIRLDGRNISNHSEIALRLPILGISPETDDLLSDTAKARQSYLDWSLFHVEPTFMNTWKGFRRVQKQRNQVLRDRKSKSEVVIWDDSFVDFAMKLTELRSKLLEELFPVIQYLVADLIPSHTLSFSYRRGWPKEMSLIESLRHSLVADMKMGFTHNGPQRSDMTIKSEGRPVVEVLSRGQQKLLLLVLRFAQAVHYSSIKTEKPIFYIDDLAAELDDTSLSKVINRIRSLGLQTILTATSLSQFQSKLIDSDRLFHVKQGSVNSMV